MNCIRKICRQLNFVGQCRQYGVKMWQCPQFLFILMGLIIIASIIATNIVAQRFTSPEIVGFIAMGLTVALFIIGHIIISSFERMAAVSREKTEFIKIMSHRLRSPLSAIKWQIDLLLNKETALKAEDEESVFWEIKKQNDKMIRIANDLIDLNLIEDRKFVLKPHSFFLKNLAEEVIEAQKDNAERQNIEIFTSIPASLPPVWADRDKIKNVTFHLLDNAIRYSPNGGKVNISMEIMADMVCVSVSDEGVGISKEEGKKIFEKFFRSGSTLRYQTEGTGIGLYISKYVVEKSGGKIGFRSIEGRGSTFWFTLPTGKPR